MRKLCLAAAVAVGLGFPAATQAFAAEPTPAEEPDVEPAALQALQRMGAYLSTFSTFQLTAETSLDIVTNDGQRVQLDGVTTYKVHRPDSFVIDLVSDVKSRTFVYDGKQFTVFAPKLGYYATVPAPATIAQTLDVLSTKFGIVLPLEDLFRWSDPSNKRPEKLDSGFVVGTATLDGVATDQYAFREGDIDWQIWIQKGDKPLPRKVVIVDRTDPANPAYVARLTWVENPRLTPDDFVFHPAKDAKPIRLTTVGQ